MRTMIALRSGVLLLAGLTAGCIHLGRRGPVLVDEREVAVYKAVTDSLYVRGARGRKIGVVATPLDTSCTGRWCLSLRARWGLDSLSWRSTRPQVAEQVREDLLARIGAQRRLDAATFGASVYVPVQPSELPPADADGATWRMFHDAKGTAAVVRFSPVGFSKDAANAIVVVQMACGVRCGHLLAVSLTKSGPERWSIHDMLLLDSP